MIGLVRGGALAVALACVLFLAACGGDSSPSPTASSASADPVAQLSSLAYDLRSREGPTQAWWVLVPRSEVDKLQDGGMGESSPSPDIPTYVAFIEGKHTTDEGQVYTWVVAYGSPDDSTVYYTDQRPETGSRAWTPLPLASP
jgi:hypothetical protein